MLQLAFGVIQMDSVKGSIPQFGNTLRNINVNRNVL